MTENKATELLLKAKVEEDETTKKIGNIFDYNPSEEGVITKIYIPTFPANYNIGLIVGSSGSGKSTILKHAFNYKDVAYDWNNSIGDGMFYEYSLVNDKFHQMSFEEYFK